MKKVLFLMIAFLLIASVGHAAQWYEGGTLHNKNGLAWQKGSHEDKLATCADILAAMWMKNLMEASMQKKIKSIDDIKPYATKLVNGLDEAFKKIPDEKQNYQTFVNQKVTDTAAIVMTLTGWTK